MSPPTPPFPPPLASPPPFPSPPNLTNDVETTLRLAAASTTFLVVIFLGLVAVGVYFASKAMPQTKAPEKAPLVSKTKSVREKAAHLLIMTVCVIIVCFVTAVLADGRSVIILKESSDLPVVTNVAAGLPAVNLEFLLGKTYGIGLHHDSSGRTWTEVEDKTLPELLDALGAAAVLDALPSVISANSLKHPVPFLECDGLRDAGRSAMGLGFIADIVAFLMFAVHGLALADLLPGPAKIGKAVMLLVWVVLSAGFFIVVVLASVIYTQEWECKQVVIPKLTLKDHFDLAYGLPFAVVGMVSSILCVIIVALGVSSTSDVTAEFDSSSVEVAAVKATVPQSEAIVATDSQA